MASLSRARTTLSTQLVSPTETSPSLFIDLQVIVPSFEIRSASIRMQSSLHSYLTACRGYAISSACLTHILCLYLESIELSRSSLQPGMRQASDDSVRSRCFLLFTPLSSGCGSTYGYPRSIPRRYKLRFHTSPPCTRGSDRMHLSGAPVCSLVSRSVRLVNVSIGANDICKGTG